MRVSTDATRDIDIAILSVCPSVMRPVFDAEYLTNSYRYGDSYYKMRIETVSKLSNMVPV